ncbi:hypothetical protein ACIA6C_27865 [Streptomyces sp. NPDC051578]|uniref:hypothetical protein n=1 Tax=Streptomyces sp. NPDC051578 TaxID=3365662 RepID=UPI0037B7FC99
MTTRREAPHHNTLTCYTRYGCRLPACVERKQNWAEERTAAMRNGTWKPYVDAAPVRQHIKALLAAGLTQDRIAALAELPHQSVADFTGGIRGRGIRHRTSADIAARILGIDPKVASPVRIGATGTHRRIQALIAVGWPLTHLSTRSGLHASRADQILRQDTVRIETAQRIQEGYDTLRRLRPERHGVPEHKARLSRDRAAAAKWPPPKYWDRFPDAIDDPHFTPEYGRTKADLLAEEATWLVTTAGLTRAEAAIRLGKDKTYIDRVLGPQRKDMRKAA